jgi:hypothetical protein
MMAYLSLSSGLSLRRIAYGAMGILVPPIQPRSRPATGPRQLLRIYSSQKQSKERLGLAAYFGEANRFPAWAHGRVGNLLKNWGAAS